MKDFEVEELSTWNYVKEYLIDILNGELTVEEARENLASFRNTVEYKGTNEKYKNIIED